MMREDRTKSFMEHMTTVFVRGGCTRRVTGAGAGRLPAARRRPLPTRQATVRTARGIIFGHVDVEERGVLLLWQRVVSCLWSRFADAAR
jgi:hypothetical protein